MIKSRYHSDFTQFRDGQVAGAAVDMDAELSGGEGGHALAHKRGDHAGQHVAAAAGGHAGVARVILIEILAVTDQRAMSLEHDHGPPPPGVLDD